MNKHKWMDVVREYDRKIFEVRRQRRDALANFIRAGIKPDSNKWKLQEYLSKLSVRSLRRDYHIATTKDERARGRLIKRDIHENRTYEILSERLARA